MCRTFALAIGLLATVGCSNEEVANRVDRADRRERTDQPQAVNSSGTFANGPTLYVLDTEGEIHYRNVRSDKLDSALETLLAEAGHPHALSEETSPTAEKPEDSSKAGDHI